jgi:hypothetical protein
MFLADRRRDGQTDMKRLIVAFRNFVSAPERPCKSLSVPTYVIFLGLRPTKYTKLID